MATASITSLGIGSGIDANTIVSKLMAIEQIPLNQLDARKSSYQSKISAFGTIKSRFDALETAAAKLADPAKLAAFTATVGDTKVISASAGSFANAGTYDIKVTQLAQAQKSFSSVYAADDTFGAGTLSFSIGGETKEVEFAGGSLNDLRNAINAADIGITATTVTGDAGARLVLTAKETGTDNAFSLSVSGGDAMLQSLASFDAAHPNARAAQNAIVEVEGETITSQSNTITSAIPNVTITAKEIGTSTLEVSRTTADTVDAVKAFVTAFNDAVKQLRTASAYDAATKSGGPLNGDATVRTLQNLLRETATGMPEGIAAGAYQTLSSLGVSFQRDGTLALDEAKLNKAISTDFAAVTQTLNAFGKAFNELGDQVTKSTGLLASRTEGLTATVNRLTEQRTAMEYRLSLTEKRLKAQFTALDSLMGQLSTTSSYLTQQLANLNSGS